MIELCTRCNQPISDDDYTSIPGHVFCILKELDDGRPLTPELDETPCVSCGKLPSESKRQWTGYGLRKQCNRCRGLSQAERKRDKELQEYLRRKEA